jgi:hypothetical protein
VLTLAFSGLGEADLLVTRSSNTTRGSSFGCYETEQEYTKWLLLKLYHPAISANHHCDSLHPTLKHLPLLHWHRPRPRLTLAPQSFPHPIIPPHSIVGGRRRRKAWSKSEYDAQFLSQLERYLRPLVGRFLKISNHGTSSSVEPRDPEIPFVTRCRSYYNKLRANFSTVAPLKCQKEEARKQNF